MELTISSERIYSARNYEPLPVVLTRAKGAVVWDEEGKSYIDMMSAYSAVSHGHCHPRLVQVLTEQVNQLAVVSRAFYTDKLGPFLKRICEVTGQDKALPMNTGAEAVETALKAARKWAYTVKGVPLEKAEIISCAGNFHGRTIAIIGMSSETQYRSGFGPFPAGFKSIPYGECEALEKSITENTAAFLVEPIQGEGGIILPPEGYLKKCAEICAKRNVLLICDEVQTGLGRTGKFLACEYEQVHPDGLILGKALGGGLLPVSLFLAKKELMDVFTPGDHGSTFGGNPLSAAVGLAAIDVLFEEDLITRAAELGKYLLDQLKTIQSSLIHKVRGRGMLIGLEIVPGYSARTLCLKLLKRGILTKDTHKTVIRFAPPFVITKEQIDHVVQIVGMALHEMESSFQRAGD